MNGIAYVDFSFTLTGAAITIPADGNITNQSVGTLIAGWEATSGQFYGLASSSTGYVATGFVSLGNISIAAVAGGATLPTGTVISLSGSYILA
jgi:hypothetical protein